MFISKEKDIDLYINKFARRFLDAAFICNDVGGTSQDTYEINKLIILSKLRQLGNRCASMQYRGLSENLYLYNIIKMKDYKYNIIMKDIFNVKESTHDLNTKDIYSGDVSVSY